MFCVGRPGWEGRLTVNDSDVDRSSTFQADEAETRYDGEEEETEVAYRIGI